MRTPDSVLVLLCAAGVLSAQEPYSPELTEATTELVKSLGVEGAGLMALRGDKVVHQSLHGKFAADQAMPIASASKWLCVATVQSLADAGVLDLDVPVSRYLSEFERWDKRAITLRQCLSCLAGFQARVTELDNPRMTMTEMAEEIARSPLRANPGTEFRYGGVTFQVAACAVERVTGKTWHEVFRTRIAEPLGMKHTSFGALKPLAAEPGKTQAPWVAGGAVSTLNDYAALVGMLANKGVYGGKRLLSEKGVDDMFADQDRSGRLRVASPSFGSRDVRYGMGTWLEQWDDQGRARRASDPGAFGWTGWVDPEAGVGGVFAVQQRVAPVLRGLPVIQDLVREQFKSPPKGKHATVGLGR